MEQMKAIWVWIAVRVGAIYIALALLASLEIIDLKTCISNSGRCVAYAKPQPTGDRHE